MVLCTFPLSLYESLIIIICIFLQSASNIFLEAIQMLQHFQETNGILGGALFYNNK